MQEVEYSRDRVIKWRLSGGRCRPRYIVNSIARKLANFRAATAAKAAGNSSGDRFKVATVTRRRHELYYKPYPVGSCQRIMQPQTFSAPTSS